MATRIVIVLALLAGLTPAAFRLSDYYGALAAGAGELCRYVYGM